MESKNKEDEEILYEPNCLTQAYLQNDLGLTSVAYSTQKARIPKSTALIQRTTKLQENQLDPCMDLMSYKAVFYFSLST